MVTPDAINPRIPIAIENRKTAPKNAPKCVGFKKNKLGLTPFMKYEKIPLSIATAMGGSVMEGFSIIMFFACVYILIMSTNSF